MFSELPVYVTLMRRETNLLSSRLLQDLCIHFSYEVDRPVQKKFCQPTHLMDPMLQTYTHRTDSFGHHKCLKLNVDPYCSPCSQLVFAVSQCQLAFQTHGFFFRQITRIADHYQSGASNCPRSDSHCKWWFSKCRQFETPFR